VISTRSFCHTSHVWPDGIATVGDFGKVPPPASRRALIVDAMAQSRSILINTVAGGATRVIGIAISFITTPILINILGDQGFGLFTLIGALTAYAGLLDFGIGPGLVRHYTEFSDRQAGAAVRQITTFSVTFYVLLFAVLIAPMAWVAPWLCDAMALQPDVKNTAILSLLLMFGYFILSCIGGVFGSRMISVHRLDLVCYVGLGGQLVYAALVIIVLPSYPTVVAAIIFNLIQVALTSSVLIFLVWAHDRRVFCNPLSIPTWLIRKILAFGGWMQINSVAALVGLELDKVIIGRFLGLSSLTPYQIGNRLASLNRLLPFQFLAAVVPAATVVSINGQGEAMEQFYIRMSRYLMVLTMPITGFVALDADRLILAWIGKPYPEAVLVAGALAISYAINNLTGGGTTIARAAGIPRYETYYALVSTVLNLVLTIALVPYFGLAGIIGGTIIANVIGSVYFLFLIRRAFSFGLYRTAHTTLRRDPYCSSSSLGHTPARTPRSGFGARSPIRVANAGWLCLLHGICTGIIFSKVLDAHRDCRYPCSHSMAW
jgi:O-antigen/teichoic acid export membrane protein